MNPDLAQFEMFGKEIIRRCMAEEEPSELRQWAEETIKRIGGAKDESALMSWQESFDFTDEMIKQYEVNAMIPERDRKVLSWPWQSWRNMIDPLEDGMLGVVTAPDGAGKTIYGESIAEFWAAHKNRVVFVHYELNRRLMMLRRTARHTGILVRKMKEGKLTPDEKRMIAEIRPRLIAWDGYISYVHTPGWTMERTVDNLLKLHNEGNCDVVVLDYLEKAAASRRQLQMFGTNGYQREADNVEQLKNFSESTGVPVLMIAQMSKDGKTTNFDKVDRSSMRGAGEKSDKANLVVLLKRDRTDGGYSNIVDVLVDKNTMGSTGTAQQVMIPELFTVGDIEAPAQMMK
jgi:hypothetical protein